MSVDEAVQLNMGGRYTIVARQGKERTKGKTMA